MRISRGSFQDAALRHAPALVLLTTLALKLSYFNLPPKGWAANEWYKWSLGEALGSFAGSYALLLLILAPLLLIGARRRLIVIWVLNLFLTLVVFADVMYFRYFGDIISLTALGGTWQLGLVKDSVGALLRPTDLFLFADVIVAPFFFGSYGRRLAAGRTAPTQRRWLRPAFALGASLLLAIPPIRAATVDEDQVFHWGFFRFYQARKIGLANYHLYEGARRLWTDVVTRSRVSPAEREHALKALAQWRPIATAPSALFGAARGRNVIVVMVESLMAFPLGVTMSGLPVTPNLNAFAARSISFGNFYGESWEGSTSDGEFTSMQSLFPLDAGAVATRFPRNNFRGLPAILAAHGYSTLSAHAFYGALYKMQEIHPRLGFQRTRFRESFKMTEELGLGLADKEFFRQVMPVVDSLPRPFMAFLITLSSHHPFKLPPEYRDLPVGELDGSLLGRYLQSLHYTDAAVGALFEQLQRNRLLDSSLVVIYGDHRAELEDDAALQRLLFPQETIPADSFDVRTWQANHRLPLLLHLPGDQYAGVRQVSGGQVDILPTVLDLLGVQDSLTTTLGRDLLQGNPALALLRSGSFVFGDTICMAAMRLGRLRVARRHLTVGRSTPRACGIALTKFANACGYRMPSSSAT